MGLLWEHRAIRYWRDKRGHEVDFVFAARGRPPVTIECKAASANFNASSLAAFRRAHPGGTNFAVTTDTKRPFAEKHSGLRVEFLGREDLIRRLTP